MHPFVKGSLAFAGGAAVMSLMMHNHAIKSKTALNDTNRRIEWRLDKSAENISKATPQLIGDILHFWGDAFSQVGNFISSVATESTKKGVEKSQELIDKAKERAKEYQERQQAPAPDTAPETPMPATPINGPRQSAEADIDFHMAPNRY
jgi:hypothetical protein